MTLPPASEWVGRPRLLLTWTRGATQTSLPFFSAQFLVRFARGLGEGVVITDVRLEDPPPAPVDYHPYLTKRAMQERLGVSGDEDV